MWRWEGDKEEVAWVAREERRDEMGFLMGSFSDVE